MMPWFAYISCLLLATTSWADMCEFKPSILSTCIDGWSVEKLAYQCHNTSSFFYFFGKDDERDGEHYIGVNVYTKNKMETVWVKRKDGHCVNNCCDKDTGEVHRRFLINCPRPVQPCVNVFNQPIVQCCNPGYDGFCCRHNMCQGVKCQHGGTCREGKCSCASGYKGTHCETVINHCSPDPCHGHGRCSNHPTSYSCLCYGGYTGSSCDRVINHCQPDPCNGRGRCSNSLISFDCNCASGYTGIRCESVIDHCQPDPCHGHGRCSSSLTGFKCTCNTGYTGTTCASMIDHCQPDPCSGHGRCSNSLTGFRCTCNAGYTGTNCTRAVHFCQPDPCHGHGRCYDLRTRFYCRCNSGYTGHTCDTAIDHCSPDPCSGHGTCYNSNAGFLCKCNTDYTGAICNQRVAHCTSNSCSGHGRCSSTTTGFHCVCNSGYTGSTCAYAIDHCSPDPCSGHGDCFNSHSGFLCSCHKGYSGTNCNPDTTIAPTTVASFSAIHHLCDKFELLIDLAKGSSIKVHEAKFCGGLSSDAVILKHCHAPSALFWNKGEQVMKNCDPSYFYQPIAEWKTSGFTDKAGILVSCHQNGFQMVAQSCTTQLTLQNITSPVADNFHFLIW